ncbi:MAG: glycosyltransferase [Methylococcales bacterium]
MTTTIPLPQSPDKYDVALLGRLKIAVFSQPEYFRFMYEHDLESFADVFEFKLQIGLSASDFKPLIEYQADYNFFFRGEYLPDGVLEQITGVKIALSSEPFPRLVDGRYEYTKDSILRYFLFRSIRYKPFDYVFHYDAASLPFLKWDRLFISGQFAFPVATSVYCPHERPKTWDIFFIGRSTAHREAHFGPLKHHYNFLHICHGIWGEPLVDYLCAAKICLNVHAENEVSWEPRMQMMLACGVFVISEKLTPNSYLRPGVDYVEIESPSELHQAVHYYLEHELERIKIAQSGRDRVLQMLDSKTSFQQLIIDLDEKKYVKFTAGSGISLLDSLIKVGDIWTKTKSRLSQLRLRLRLRLM